MSLDLGHKAKHLAERAKHPMKRREQEKMMNQPALWSAIAMASLGLGAIIYWIVSSSDKSDHNDNEWEE